MSSNSDTRHIIRPEHFVLAPQLVGLELARPSRRLAAILIDLLVVAILVHLAGGFLLALAAAYAFFRFASRSNMAMSTRLAVRLAAALILFMLVKRGYNAATDYATGMLTDAPKVAVASAGAGRAPKPPAKPAEPGVGTAIRLTTGLVALKNADDESTARPIAEGLVSSLRESGLDDEEIRDAFQNVAEESDKEWMGEVVNAVIPAAPARAAVPAESLAVHYAAALTAGDSAAADSLRPRVASALAHDSLAALRGELKTLRRTNEGLETAARVAEESAEEGKGFLGTLMAWLDDLGIGFGWTGLYFTAFTAIWRGQTPGKRLLGVRVLRLDGKPLTLWASFERFGGYAAGLVTGLLGFAQVIWDRNRQAIHDKISETVVVRERDATAAPVNPPLPHPLPDRRGA